MFIFYTIIIFTAFMVFRRIILDNSNVKQLDFGSFVIVFIAASEIPKSLIEIAKFLIKLVV